MTLLDTNVVIDAHNPSSPHQSWARDVISSCVLSDGAAISAVTLAELHAGPAAGEAIEEDMRQTGVAIMDVPGAAAASCGRAYSRYREARRRSGGSKAPHVPLPDFFIGAHAELMGWKLATRDTERYRRYFPGVQLVTSPS